MECPRPKVPCRAIGPAGIQLRRLRRPTLEPRLPVSAAPCAATYTIAIQEESLARIGCPTHSRLWPRPPMPPA
eukprot:6861624-Pyramimonas_sp.AAC.1